MTDLIVVGGGIAGLALGHLAARQGRKVLVLEKADVAGGCVRSSRIETEEPGEPFWLELGAHTLYNSYATLIGLLEECGLAGSVLPREKLPFLLLADGKLRKIPSQVSWPELLASLPALLWTPREGQTIRAYYSRVLGEHNYERVFRALFDAVACQDTTDFGVAYLFKKRPSRRKDYRRSFTLAGGLGTLIGALCATPGLTVETRSEVRAVARRDGKFEVTLQGGSARSCRVLALAVPPGEGANLLEGCYPDIAGILAEIRTHRLYSLGVAVRPGAVALPRLAGIVSAGDSFYSVVSRDVLPHPESRAFTFHFGDGDREAGLQRTEAVLGVGREQFVHARWKESELPTLAPDHAGRIARLDDLATGRNLLLAGNWVGGLSLEDCVARSADQARKLACMLS